MKKSEFIPIPCNRCNSKGFVMQSSNTTNEPGELIKYKANKCGDCDGSRIVYKKEQKYEKKHS